ncbi:aspartate/glutamate racemase family protein [Paracoccus sp. WLY502]|uniref:aspartate racemase/maleate isomerase family protein n=1 Tax=Paracoccus yibinensis TaxID=3068891 RepID=UPI002796E1CB|nr:aspartate/glutamate racemase family protein [Paracoccus sp. WLY502]MDQ1901144.1 aspartate/glutamate racemase family protein [Paracoccus sp. WLY502]
MTILDLPLTLDDRPLPRRVGLVTLATDHTTEVDFATLPPRGIGVYATRIPFANPVTPETLAAMAGDVTRAAALILPDEGLDAVVYSCTSASVVIGDDRVRAAIDAGKPGARAITPISAGFAALRALGADRITLLTPYTPQTTRPMADCFEGGGFALRGISCLNMTDDRAMARLSHATIIEAARAAVAPGSQALFIACTAVRAAGIAARIEDAVGLPVVSANLATLWAALRACGDAGAALPGQLMRLS